MAKKWVLFLMGNPHLRRLYERLLDRRGYQVHSTRNVEEADRILKSGEVGLAVIDEDVDEQAIRTHLDEWTNSEAVPPLVLLTTPGADPPTSLDPTPMEGVDLLLQKPISPMEFGLQLDELVGGMTSTGLEEDSMVERDFDAIEREFVFQLDEDLHHLESLWDHVIASPQSAQRPVMALRRAVAPIRAAARQFGFAELGDDLEIFESFLEGLLDADGPLSNSDRKRGHSILDALLESSQALQRRYPIDSQTTHIDTHPHTLLVVDPDEDFLDRIQTYGEQFMVRVRTARTIEEAIQRVRTPLLTGVALSMSATSSASTFRQAIDRLREASPLSSLPLALVGEDGEDLDGVRSLWTGASVLASKPVTMATFSRIVSRLAALRRAQKASILLIEPDEDFARFLARNLETRHTAVHFYEHPRQLFEKLDRHRPDLVLLSTHLSGVSPYDICRALRAIPRWRATPLVMTARRDQAELRLAAFQSGADDVICRGIDPEELRARIRVRLERIRLMRERADRDSLTGLLTRRAFLEQLAGRLSEAHRHRRNLSFILLDVDRFKQVNDDYGHPAGDRVLKTLGELLRDCFRIEDLRSRWGGEEFAVVLIDEDGPTTRQALERILEEFQQIPFQGADGQEFHVTFSAGIAEYPEDGHDAETLLSTADSRLLRAKQAGRNTIIGPGL